jgi:hypothetical protein
MELALCCMHAGICDSVPPARLPVDSRARAAVWSMQQRALRVQVDTRVVKESMAGDPVGSIIMSNHGDKLQCCAWCISNPFLRS